MNNITIVREHLALAKEELEPGKLSSEETAELIQHLALFLHNLCNFESRQCFVACDRNRQFCIHSSLEPAFWAPTVFQPASITVQDCQELFWLPTVLWSMHSQGAVCAKLLR